MTSRTNKIICFYIIFVFVSCDKKLPSLKCYDSDYKLKIEQGEGLLLLPSGSLDTFQEITYNYIEYKMVIGSDSCPIFISTTSDDLTINEYKVGKRVVESSKLLNIPGWGTYFSLGNNWYAGLDEDTQQVSFFFAYEFY